MISMELCCVYSIYNAVQMFSTTCRIIKNITLTRGWIRHNISILLPVRTMKRWSGMDRERIITSCYYMRTVLSQHNWVMLAQHIPKVESFHSLISHFFNANDSLHTSGDPHYQSHWWRLENHQPERSMATSFVRTFMGLASKISLSFHHSHR